MYGRTYGDKYDNNLSTTAVAAKVRQEIKELVKKGELPKCKYSVTRRYFANGSAIDVRISSVPFPFLSIERIWYEGLSYEEQQTQFEPRARYSDKGAQLLKAIEAILWAYNHDGSDAMIDYFDVNFYGHVCFDWQEEQRVREWLVTEALVP